MIPAQRDDLAPIAAAAAAGDPLAQAAFVRATQAEVWRLAAALVDRDAADDLTQETYLRALTALPSFEGRAGVRTWLLSIARRTCADHLRAVVRRRRLGDRLLAAPIEPGPDQTGLVDGSDLLRRLDPERRAAFVLTQLVGLSYQEAADVEGVPVGTIRSRVARARAHLVDALSAPDVGWDARRSCSCVLPQNGTYPPQRGGHNCKIGARTAGAPAGGAAGSADGEAVREFQPVLGQ